MFVHILVLLLCNQLLLSTQKGITEHLRMALRDTRALVVHFAPDAAPWGGGGGPVDGAGVKSSLKVFW